MNKITVSEVDPREINWDSLIGSVPEGTVYQTTYWARYLEKYAKIKPLFFIAKGEKNEILASLFLYRTNAFKRLLRLGVLGNLASKVINKFIPVFTWNFGPLIYDKYNYDEIFEYFIGDIIRRLSRKGMILLRQISVPIHGDREYMTKAHNILMNLNFCQKQISTILINLRKKESELWANLNHSARKAIKKTDALKLNISLMTREKADDYYRILMESRKRSRIELPPNYPNSIMWDELGGERKILNVISASKDNNLLGAIGILNFNGIIFETGPAQSDYSFKNKIYVHDMLKWLIIKNGKAMGARLYDLCGIFLNPKNEKERNLNRFKEKWGGDKFVYNRYNKFLWKGTVKG